MVISSLESGVDRSFEPPIHLDRLGDLADDVRLVLAHRLISQRAVDHLRSEGHLRTLIPRGIPKNSYEYGLHVNALVSEFHPEVDEMCESTDRGISNWGVWLLPTRALRFIHNSFEFASGYKRFLSEEEIYFP